MGSRSGWIKPAVAPESPPCKTSRDPKERGLGQGYILENVKTHILG